MFRGLAFILLLGIAGCGASEAKRLEGNWLLERKKDREEENIPPQMAPILVFDKGMVTEVDSPSRIQLLSYRAKTPYRVEDGRITVGEEEAQIVELTSTKLVYLRGAEYTFRRVSTEEVEAQIERRWGKKTTSLSSNP